MKKFIAMVLASVVCCLLLVGCGDSKYVGTYTYELLGTKMSIELKDDHKATVFGESGAKWEVKDDKIILSDESGDDSETIELDINDDGDLEMSEGGITMTFEKEED